MPDTDTWYLAVCLGCTPLLPQPFSNPGERATWAGTHEHATGHVVAIINQYPAAEPKHPAGWTYLGRDGGGGQLFIAAEGTPLPDAAALLDALGAAP